MTDTPKDLPKSAGGKSGAMDIIERHYSATPHTVLTDELWADLRKLLPAYEAEKLGNEVILDAPREEVRLALDSLRLRKTFESAGLVLKESAKVAEKDLQTLRKVAELATKHDRLDEVAKALNPILDITISNASARETFGVNLHKNTANNLNRSIKEAAQAYALAAGVKLAELSPGSKDAPNGKKGPVYAFVVAVLEAGKYKPDSEDESWEGVWVHLNKAIKESRQKASS